jgi:hypothetical protein
VVTEARGMNAPGEVKRILHFGASGHSAISPKQVMFSPKTGEPCALKIT